MNRSSFVVLAALLAGAAAPACNAITGADDLGLNNKLGGTGAGDEGSTTGDVDPPPPPPLSGAPGVNINEIAIYQGVKRPLMAGGAKADSDIPIVAGRAALIRVFYTLDAAYDGQPVTARLILGEGGDPIDVVQSLSGTSSDGSLSSTINFELPGSSIATDFRYQILVGQDPSERPVTGLVEYPGGAIEDVGATSVGDTLKIELVPVAYQADGSGRLPDTSDEQLQLYHDAFLAMYPVPNVEISVHAPLDWNGNISANGGGWGEILDKITNMRLEENTPQEIYFYGIFSPKGSFGQYCSGGCVTGLGNLGGPGDNYSRAAVGIGYSGSDSVDTSLHEIGHTHGRQHAPCQTFDSDPKFPYSNGGIGVWGYDFIQKRLYDPKSITDIMGYCSPTWLSDYTFDALVSRIKSVNNAKITYPAASLDRLYERVRLDGQGGAVWLDPIRLHTPPIADKTTVIVETDAGEETLVGQFYPYDHLEGGVMLWPAIDRPLSSVQILVASGATRIAR